MTARADRALLAGFMADSYGVEIGFGQWMLVGVPLTVTLIVALVALVILLTELTSNLATTAAVLPVVTAVAVESGWAPIALTAPVALAAS